MYSQNNEEKIILDYFGDYVGTFLDLGCNDCVTFSNTKALVDRGWKGVLVDCSPPAIEKCKELYKKRKGLYVYDNAVGAPHPVTKKPFNGKIIFNDSGSILNNGDGGLVGTFYPEEMDRFKRITTYNPIEVQTYTWKTFFNRPPLKQYDMISIDVEGSERNILPYMDLSTTRLMCVEWNGKHDLKTEYEKYLQGFRLIYTSGENLIYAR